MPSYILFNPMRHELRLRCARCHKDVILSTSARLTPTGELAPDPSMAIRQHYVLSPFVHAKCENWFGETQDFYVKDVTRHLPTRKFSWPDSEDEEDYEYFVRCGVCGTEEGYSGTIDVGSSRNCEICEHPLIQHEIIVSTIFADPETGEFEIPRFR